MLKYAKITDEQTGLCEVGIGTNAEFYQSIGMTEQDVCQSSVDGNWYLSEKCPQKTYEQLLLEEKNKKHEENTRLAKLAVENGHVVFKGAEFETNAQTVGDLTATMLLMQASEIETYMWLSKDDQVVALTVEDFGTLGGLIAGYKNTIWQEKYINYKTQIEQAQSVEAVNAIVLDYSDEVAEWQKPKNVTVSGVGGLN